MIANPTRAAAVAQRVLLVTCWGLAAWSVIYFTRTYYLDSMDLAVYQWGGQALVNGEDLYGPAADRVTAVAVESAAGLPFTYPPFAAVLFATIAWLPWQVLVVSVGLASVLALGHTMWMLLRAAGYPKPPLVFLISAVLAGLLLEPTIETLGFGQINLLLLWLVCLDILRPDSRIRGAWTGLATGIKLTPGIFLLLYFVVGSWRRFVVGALTFAATVLVPVLFVGLSQVVDYWTSIMWNAQRVGSPAYATNQSINGLLWRTLGPEPPIWLWALLSLLIVAPVLVAARRQWTRWRLLPLAITSLTMLLISPISWSHHWVWVLPALVVFFRLRRNWPSLLLLISGLLLLMSRLPQEGLNPEFVTQPMWWQFLVGESYVLWGLLALGYLLWLSRDRDKTALDLTAPSTDGRRPQRTRG